MSVHTFSVTVCTPYNFNVDVKHYNAVYLAYRNTGSHNHRYDMHTKTNTALYSSARQALYGTTFSDKTLPTDRKNN